MRLALLLIGLVLTPCVQAAGPLPQYEAIYEVSRGNVGGESVMQLSPMDGDRWEFKSHLRTTGLLSLVLRIEIEETSRFTLEQDNLVPLQHLYRFHGGSKNRDFTLDFDWIDRRVHGTVRGEPAEAPLDAGAVDRHAMIPALMLELAGDEPRFPQRYIVIDRARIRHFEVFISGEETLDTGAGRYDTLRVVQQRLDDETRRFVSWNAPELDYIPVRIESQDDEGRTVTMILKELSLAEPRRRGGKEEKN